MRLLKLGFAMLVIGIALCACGIFTLDAQAQSWDDVTALACIMQGEAAILGPDGARIVGHVALNRLAWYDDITMGWNGCLDGEPSREYLWLAWDVIAEHHSVDSDYMFCYSAADCERLGLPASNWSYEAEIGGRTWGVYAYTNEEVDE